MLSIDFIRENKERVALAAKNKNRKVDLDSILQLDDSRRALIGQVQKLREERNSLASAGSDESARERVEDPERSRRGRVIKDELKKLETELTEVETKLNNLLLTVPNVYLDEVPVGTDESGNVETSKWGSVPEFDFTPLSHIELGEKLDLIDLKRGTKVSGFRGYFLKNEAATLQMSLMMYVLNKLIAKGYTPIIAPAIVKSFTLLGNGQFPWGKDEVYALNDDDAYLAGTAEVPVTAYFANETFDEKDLPKKFVAFSPCFRREAGSYGKDTKGLYRVHEFFKIEQVIIAKADIEEAKKMHEELQVNCEEILQELQLPYRVLLMCTGDMGEPQMKKYDTEVWMPSRAGYGETMSNSIMGDFQTRRLNIKYRDADGNMHFTYSLNNTAIAFPRILIPLLENNQQKDGSIKIPDALVQYTGFEFIK